LKHGVHEHFWALAHPYSTQLSTIWVRYFVEPDLFDNNVPFDNITLNNDLSDQSALEIRVTLTVALF